jgi:hypothetical protein
MPVTQRSFVAGNFLLRLDGVDAGFVKSIDGGAIHAEVINEPAGQSFFVKKHIGAPKYEDFAIQIGWWMGKGLYDWIAASWKMNYTRKNGSIVNYDVNLEARSEREFFNAVITEVQIPAMDGASKDQAYMTVKFAPEFIRAKKASGKATMPPVKAAQEMWLASNFRLEIDGLDCTKVNAIDAFTVKQTAVRDDIGDARDFAKEPGRLEFPNLTITLAETAASTWHAWFEEFVVNGINDDGHEKNGSLMFLSPNRQSELGRVNFFNLGIFKLAPAKVDAAIEKIPRVTAELYCERMELQMTKP